MKKKYTKITNDLSTYEYKTRVNTDDSFIEQLQPYQMRLAIVAICIISIAILVAVR